MKKLIIQKYLQDLPSNSNIIDFDIRSIEKELNIAYKEVVRLAKVVKEKPDNPHYPFILSGKEEKLHGICHTLILLGYETRYQDGKEFSAYEVKEGDVVCQI